MTIIAIAIAIFRVWAASGTSRILHSIISSVSVLMRDEIIVT